MKRIDNIGKSELICIYCKKRKAKYIYELVKDGTCGQLNIPLCAKCLIEEPVDGDLINVVLGLTEQNRKEG